MPREPQQVARGGLGRQEERPLRLCAQQYQHHLLQPLQVLLILWGLDQVLEVICLEMKYRLRNAQRHKLQQLRHLQCQVRLLEFLGSNLPLIHVYKKRCKMQTLEEICVGGGRILVPC